MYRSDGRFGFMLSTRAAVPSVEALSTTRTSKSAAGSVWAERLFRALPRYSARLCVQIVALIRGAGFPEMIVLLESVLVPVPQRRSFDPTPYPDAAGSGPERLDRCRPQLLTHPMLVLHVLGRILKRVRSPEARAKMWSSSAAPSPVRETSRSPPPSPP